MSHEKNPNGSRFQEADLIPTRPEDFNILRLDEYPASELMHLMSAAAYMHGAITDAEMRRALNVWCYRIRDAYKEAARREDNAKEFSQR